MLLCGCRYVCGMVYVQAERACALCLGVCPCRRTSPSVAQQAVLLPGAVLRARMRVLPRLAVLGFFPEGRGWRGGTGCTQLGPGGVSVLTSGSQNAGATNETQGRKVAFPFVTADQRSRA